LSIIDRGAIHVKFNFEYVQLAPSRLAFLEILTDVNLIRNNPQNPQKRVVECPKIPKYSDLG